MLNQSPYPETPESIGDTSPRDVIIKSYHDEMDRLARETTLDDVISFYEQETHDYFSEIDTDIKREDMELLLDTVKRIATESYELSDAFEASFSNSDIKSRIFDRAAAILTSKKEMEALTNRNLSGVLLSFLR